MSRKYTPISCDTYSRYELAILRGQGLRVAWRGARGIDRVEHLQPVDLRTRTGGEYMIARNLLGQRRVMRLDRIRRVETLPNRL
jgi:Rho-binding antiterminator